jgi:hypothetical protein
VRAAVPSAMDAPSSGTADFVHGANARGITRFG